MRTGNGRQSRQGQWTGESVTPPSPVTPLLRATGLLLLAAYLTAVTWYALRPVPAAWVYDANLQPLASIRRDLATGDYRALATSMLLTAPLGVLLPMAGGRLEARWLPSLLRTIAAAGLLCTALEVMQTGVPGHVLDVDDVLLNVLGVTLAHLAVVPCARAALRHRHRPPHLDHPHPTRPPRQRTTTSGTHSTTSYEIA